MSDKRAGAIETLVAELAATLAPGRRVGLEEGITLTVDAAGRVRFQVRLRLAGRDSKRKTATVDTLEQARELRAAFRQEKKGGSSLARGEQLTRLSFEQYAQEQWWSRHVLKRCGDVTQVGYRQKLENDLLPFLGQVKVADLSEELIESWLEWLQQQLADPEERRRRGEAKRQARRAARALDESTGKE